MKTFYEALLDGFVPHKLPDGHLFGYYSFTFGRESEYELCFEPLLFDEQYYVALYKNKELLTEKVVIKPGFIKPEEEI